MKFFLKQYIYLLPIIMLVASLLSVFIDFNYVLLGNFLGYSILTNIVFFYHFYYGNYCIFTRIAPIGLLAINIVDIIGCFCSETFYNFWYVVSVFSLILTLTFIFEINKRLKK